MVTGICRNIWEAAAASRFGDGVRKWWCFERLLQSEKPLSYHTRWELVLGIAEGLRTLHRHGIIHGDVKAENVLLNIEANCELIAKLADFACPIMILVDWKTSFLEEAPHGINGSASWPHLYIQTSQNRYLFVACSSGGSCLRGKHRSMRIRRQWDILILTILWERMKGVESSSRYKDWKNEAMVIFSFVWRPPFLREAWINSNFLGFLTLLFDTKKRPYQFNWRTSSVLEAWWSRYLWHNNGRYVKWKRDDKPCEWRGTIF